jgi:hypothetical protein
MDLDWATFKTFITTRALAIQYIDVNGYYYLKCFDGPFSLSCKISKDAGADVTEFEASYKPTGNTSPLQATYYYPYSAKKFITSSGLVKNLYTRNVGTQNTVVNGANTINYTATFAWCKMIGMEAINGLAGDYASMYVYDTPAGTYSGTPNLLLNRYGYDLNIAPGYYEKKSQFDADVYVGMILRVIYTSVTTDSRFLGINFLMNEVKT